MLAKTNAIASQTGGSEMESDVATELAQRVNGPFSLRLLLQPTMALLFAIRDGRKDAKDGSVPYLRRLKGGKSERREAISSAWASLVKILVMAVVLDSAFQFVTEQQVHLIQSIGIACLLCFLPYSVMRGPAAVIAGRRLDTKG